MYRVPQLYLIAAALFSLSLSRRFSPFARSRVEIIDNYTHVISYQFSNDRSGRAENVYSGSISFLTFSDVKANGYCLLYVGGQKNVSDAIKD